MQLLKLPLRIFISGLVASLLITGCTSHGEAARRQEPVTIDYWEKWTAFERDAMKAVVDDFNASQDKIHVNMLTVSQIDRKFIVATAGGDPPDVAGLWSFLIPVVAEQNAVVKLDHFLAQADITKDQYVPVFWKLCSHHGHIWGMPTTPGTMALHWNKKLFREAGLDPERPPKTIAELDEFARKLTRKNEKGDYTLLGFLQPEPGWWNQMWGYWFGAELWNGRDKITTNSPENIAAFTWVQSYAKNYDINAIQNFRGGFGSFSSAQNAYLAGKVAMEIQGVWMYNFISQFAPDMEWGAAPFPSAKPDLKDVTIAECDVLVIPRGARHPKEAFEFIKFVQTQKEMEKLCLGQRKFSPLSKVSPEFYEKHPNPYIKVFADLARSPNAKVVPQTSVWQEYSDEMISAFDSIWLLKESPKEALDKVQKRVQHKLNIALRRWRRIAKKRLKEWEK